MGKFDSVIDKAIEAAKEQKRLAEESDRRRQQKAFESSLPFFLEMLKKAIGQDLVSVMTFEFYLKSSDGVKAKFSYNEADFELWRWQGTHSSVWYLTTSRHGTKVEEEIPNQFFNASRLAIAIDKLYNS